MTKIMYEMDKEKMALGNFTIRKLAVGKFAVREFRREKKLS